MILPRTPQPKPTEGLFGYLLRVSEANGYESPWRIFRLAGLAQSRMKTPDLPLVDIAPLVNTTSNDLERLAYHPPSGKVGSDIRLLGHSLTTKLTYAPLRWNAPALCAECVSENGFIDAFFDLGLAVACPIHRRRVLSACGDCGQRMTWFRPGLANCKCGARFRPATAAPAELVELMSVLRAKLHGDDPANVLNPCGLPVANLLAMPLRSLLTMISALANFGNPSSKGNPAAIADSAADALRKWPEGFHKYLAAAMTTGASSPIAYRKRYASFYAHLFKRKATAPYLGWMREEMYRFAFGASSSASVECEANTFEKRQLAEMLREKFGVGRHASSTKPPLSPANATPDAEAAPMQPAAPPSFQVLPARQAADYVRLPVRVLMALKASGHLPGLNRPKEKRGFHELDLQSLVDRLLALSESLDAIPTAADETVSLPHALAHFRFHSNEEKARFVVAFLTGSIRSIGRVGRSVDDVLFRRSDVTLFVAKSRSKVADGSISQQEVARFIGCDPQAVGGLIETNLLEEVNGREGRRVTKESVHAFKERYRALSDLAQEHASSSRRLNRICGTLGIACLRVPRAGNRADIPFIDVRYVPVLLAHLRQEGARYYGRAKRSKSHHR